MKITVGSLSLPNQVIQAPLAGVSDHAFRVVARLMGCGLTFSEMINAKGLLHAQQRTLSMIGVREETRPMAVQIFGREPEIMARAAEISVEHGADLIDINMGCPASKVVKNFEGSALMRDLPRAAAVIHAVARAVTVPVTVKMRRGWETGEDTCLELAAIAEAEGAAAVTIHPRSRNQLFSGQADWEVIRAVKQGVRIPVIGNGDIVTPEDARRMLELTGCDAVMIGRAAMGDPFIFRETVALLETGVKIARPSWEERRQLALLQLDLAVADKGERIAVREMRKHFSWYIKGCRGAAQLRQVITAAETRAEIIAALNLIPGD
jgi:nifR3 family TIM-barrel protein